MSRIDAEQVWKIYPGGVVGVRNVSFTCKHGEFLAILGPSGGGKSSLLRMIAGLETISKGSVSFDGEVINELTPAERNIALAFESYALYQHLSVYENVAFPLKAAGVPKNQVERKVREMAELLNLQPFLRRFPSELAGGQQQRVSLARALVRNPRVTLLDEPISHMDQRVRMGLRATIRHLHDRLGLTTIYVTHDQAEATSLCDRLLIINKAEVQQIGSVDEIWDYPANKFVAQFVGEPAMNFVDGVVEAPRLMAVPVDGAWRSIRTAGVVDPAHVGKPVTIGFRPQEVEVLPPTGMADSTMSGTVRVVEPQGHLDILTVDLEDASRTEVKTVVPAARRFYPSDVVNLRIRPEDVHVFVGELPILRRESASSRSALLD